LRESRQGYDKRVAGVISGAGSCRPAILLDKRQCESNRQPIALLGKAYCKVDAQYGAVEVGDLLTTSTTPGYAMRTEDPLKAFGAVIGKALHPLKEGMCLASLEGSGSGDLGYETGGALGASSRQRSEDLPGSGTFWSFIAAGDFARNHRGAQLTFGQIVSGLDAIMIQEGKEMIALFMESMAHGLFVGFAARRLQ
jgi:hypothetical protein